MKIIIALLITMLLSFGTQQERTVTLKLTVPEVQLIYDALGELPAKQVEQLRLKILVEAQRQLADTAKKK